MTSILVFLKKKLNLEKKYKKYSELLIILIILFFSFLIVPNGTKLRPLDIFFKASKEDVYLVVSKPTWSEVFVFVALLITIILLFYMYFKLGRKEKFKITDIFQSKKDTSQKDNAFPGYYVPILLLCGLFFLISEKETYGFFIITFAMAVWSINLAYNAKKISIASDNKIKAFSNVYFIELIEKFRDFFLQCIVKENDNSQTYHKRNDIYKWRMDLKKAMEFKQWSEINEDQKTALTSLFVSIFENLPWNREWLTNYDVRHLLGMCGRVIEFKMVRNNKDKFDRLLTEHIGERRNDEDYTSFINRKIRELQERDLDEIYER